MYIQVLKVLAAFVISKVANYTRNADVGGNMQNSKIYSWAKAELERYKKSASYSDISEHWCSFIEDELLPKLEEILQTSSNTQSKPCSHPSHHSTNSHIVYCQKCGEVIG